MWIRVVLQRIWVKLGWSRLLQLSAATFVVAAVPAVLIWIPERMAATRGLEPKEHAAEVGRARTSLLTLCAGVIASVGLLYTGRTFGLNREGQITERFTRAIDQLGADKLEIRLGAIYALGRIARESRVDHGPIMEILSGYVRERAPWHRLPGGDVGKSERGDGERHHLPPDVQAAIAVMTRRETKHDDREMPIRLAQTDLRGADFRAGELSRAVLAGTRLDRSNLKDTTLVGASFVRADMTAADLSGAVFSDADMSHATLTSAVARSTNLRGARLAHADLRHADLSGARLGGADFSGADLTGAVVRAADLTGAVFFEADLSHVDFSNAVLTGRGYDGFVAITERGALTEVSSRAYPIGFQAAQNSEQLRVPDCRLSFAGAELAGANFAGVDLHGVDFSDADLSQAVLTRASLVGATYTDGTIWPAHIDPDERGAILLTGLRDFVRPSTGAKRRSAIDRIATRLARRSAN